MKKKGLFAFLIAIFSLVATLGYVSRQDVVSFTEAEVSTASKWDGSVNAVENVDYVSFEDQNGKKLKIFTAKGLAYYASAINNGYTNFDNHSVYLERDIDLNNETWTPICINESFAKSIYFDGQHHTIYNLKVSGKSYAGLFGYLVGGKVENLCLSGASIVGNSCAGGFVGGVNSIGGFILDNVKILNNSSVLLSAGSGKSSLGGLVGYTYGTFTIQNSISSARISTTVGSAYLGGLVGFAETSSLTVSSSAFDGIIDTSARSNGGLVGSISSTSECKISNTYSSAKIDRIESNSDSSYFGGLVGYVQNSGTTFEIEDSYNYFRNLPSINNVPSYIGGLVGYVAAGSDYTFNNLYQVGKFESVNVLDWNGTGKHANLYYKSSSATIAGVNVLSFTRSNDLDEGAIKSNYAGFDFDNTWKFVNYKNVNNGLPILMKVENSGFANSQSTTSVTSKLDGKGTLAEPYLIKTAGDLAFLSLEFNKSSTGYASKYFVLLNDVDLTGKTWIPIGNNTAFKGVFDGFGHSVNGISSSMQASFDQFGLFGKVSGATIKNLTVKNVMFLSGGNSGAIAGVVSSESYFINCLSDQVALGSNTGNAKVVYGKDCLKTENVNWASNVGSAKGYEIEVDPNGGAFYNAATPSNVRKIEGEYKIVVSGNDVLNLSNYDEFYKTSTPTDTTVAGSDYAIKVGSKFDGIYSAQQNGIKLFDDKGETKSLDFGVISKIYAQWESGKKIKITFDCNPYERNGFDATEKFEKEFEVDYNASLESVWTNYSPIVERAGFVPKFYYDGEFSNEVTNKDVWVNEDKTIYIKWESDNVTTNIFTLNLEKSATLGEGSFDFSDAIETVVFKGRNGNNEEAIVSSSENGVYTFYVKTQYSTTMDNWLELSITLKEGFSGEIYAVPSSKDARWGNLKTKGISEVTGADKNWKGNQTFTFYNLDENCNLNITIKRLQYTNQVVYDGHFTLAPAYEIEAGVELDVYADGTQISCDLNNGDLLGFDFAFNEAGVGYLVSTKDAQKAGDLYKVVEKRINFDESYSSVYFEFKKNGVLDKVYKYYQNDGAYILGLCNDDWEVVDIVAQLKKDGDNVELSYYHDASFAMIFAVGDKEGDEGAEYSSYSIQLNGNADSTESAGFKEIITDEYRLKLYAFFENINKNINDDNPIEATKKNVKILLDYQFVEEVVDEKGNVVLNILTNNDVVISGNPYICNVADESVGGKRTIEFSFENGKLYKLDKVKFFEGDDELVPNTAGGQKISKIDTNKNPIEIEYSSDLLAGRYTIKLVCVKQVYTLKGEAVISNDWNDIQCGEFLDIKPVSFESGLLEGDKFYYDTANVRVVTEQNNYLYKFVGWALRKGDTIVYFADTNVDGYGKIHGLGIDSMSFVYDNSTNINGEFTVYAVYTRKTYKLVSGDYAYLATDAENISSLDDPFLSYNISAKVADKDTTVDITKKGANKNAYYVTGIKIVYNGETAGLPEVNNYGTEKTSYSDLNADLIKYIKENPIDENLVSFVIYPIFAKKTVIVSIKSNKETLDESQYVYDSNGEETKDYVLTSTFNFGDVVNLTSISTGEVQLNMSDKFASRKGFTVAGTGWKYAYGYYDESDNKVVYENSTDYDVYDEDLTITASMFNNNLSRNIVIFRTWKANTYVVTIDPNGGLVSNYSIFTFQTRYQEEINSIGYGKTDFSKYGYEFDGLYYNDKLVYDSSFGIAQDNGVVSSIGKYLLDQNVTLLAHWTPDKKTIKVFANGNKDGSVALYTEYNEDYNSEESIKHVVQAIASSNPTRTGFVYNGLKYVASGRVVNETDLFNADLTEFVVSPEINEANLSMYIDWEYEDYYTFDLNEEFIDKKETVYSGQNQNYSIAEFLFDGNQSLFSQTGYTIAYTSSKLSVVADGSGKSVDTTVLMTFGAEELTDNSVFAVKNSGDYTARLQVSISDKAEYGNKGEIASFSVDVGVFVAKADIDFSLTQDTKLCNVKLILKNFFTGEELTSLNACREFEEFVSFVKTVETSLEGKTDDEIYEYTIVKYTLMIEESRFETFKDFDYDAFVEYKNQYAEKVGRIVEDLKLFTFFDYKNKNENENIFATYYDCIQIESEAENQIFARSGELVTYGFEVLPRNSYVYRLYISSPNIAELANFNLNYEDGNAYFTFEDSVYILPQVLRVENSGKSSKTYYKKNSPAKIDWNENITSRISVEDETYYEIDTDIFMKGELYTSNDGRKDVDIIYSTFDRENYLYFNNVRIMVLENGSYQDKTNWFVVLPEVDESYTIANINNVATINVSAKYFTQGDYVLEFKDLPVGYGQNLIKITGIRYNDAGEIKTYYNEQGLEVGNYDCFEIVANNSNTVTIFTTEAVESFTVSTDSIVLDYPGNGYVKLYKWTDEEVEDVDGTMEKDGAHEFVLSEIKFDEGEVSTVNLYSVYTDLVLVNYVYDFPSTFNHYSIDKDYLKLGASAIDDFILPQERGFKLTSLMYTDPQNHMFSYENLFADGVFKGVSSSEPHTAINLYAEWQIEDFDYVQKVEQIKRSAARLNVIGFDDIVEILNRNENLYSYSYEWKKGDKLLSSEESLVFSYGGKVADSGEYTLKIIATIHEDFRGKVVSDTNQLELTFDITLFAPKIVSAEFKGENEVVYNAKERLQDWFITVKTIEYDEEIDDYSDGEYIQDFRYTQMGLITFELTKNSKKVDSMKNVGDYKINLSYSVDDYTCENDIDTVFDFKIIPYEFDISTVEIQQGKKFNAIEPELKTTINTGLENVEIKFARQSGEDVGEYNVFVADDLNESCFNYIFNYDGVVAWRNGHTNTNVIVGKFEITTANALKVYYEETAQNPQNITYTYNLNGFTLSLSNNYALNIKSDNVIQKTLNLVLFDVEKGEVVANPDVLNILKYYSYDLTPKFFSTEEMDLAEESGSYTYKFECGSEFLKRYYSVEFEKGYQFTIGKVQINIDSLQANKVYDGTNYIYFDINGNRITSVQGREVYIIGKYDSKHVGKDIKVEFDFGFSEGTINANYQFSANSTLADIEKRTVSATVSLRKKDFVYGDISVYNFENYIGDITLKAEDVDYSDVLEEGYYSVSYALSDEILKNEAGLLCAGEYTIVGTYDFADFEISNFEIEKFTVSVLNVERNLVEGMFRVVVGAANANGPHTETFKAPTGDILELSYQSAVAGLLDVGHYNIVLTQNMFVNNSINVTINEQNQSLYVISSDEVVYMSIADESIFMQTYNASAYEISLNLVTKQIVVSNGVNEYASAFTLKEVGHTEEIDISNIASISIHYLQDVTTFVNAGTYRLGISYSSNRYPNIVLDQNYDFVVQRRAIDVTKLEVEKVYDGSAYLDIFEFDEKIDIDNVYITARFDNILVGEDKEVSFVLNGTESVNYQISGVKAGKITKAQAVVTLAKTEFVYGHFTKTDKLTPVVVCGEDRVSTYQYTINFTINGAIYAENIWGYLNVGEYTVTMNGNSDNYDLVFENTNILVTAYDLDLVFETSGSVTSEYGSLESKQNTFGTTYQTPLFEEVVITVTRESGSLLGYYKALSAVCENENYNITSVLDTSDGMYRIVKSNEVIYILLVDENEQIVDTVYAQYSAAEYNSIQLVVENGNYCLKISSNVESKTANLKAFRYNDQTAEYEVFDEEIENLSAIFSFVGTDVKDVGTYTYYSDYADSTNYQIRFEKYGENSNKFVVTKRNLYFKGAELSKQFDNKSAVFECPDAKEVLDGILESDNFGLTYSFYDNVTIARYVKNLAHYRVEASLIDEDGLAENYVLNMTTAEGDEVYGIINRAIAMIYINSRAGTYGDTINLSVRYELQVDDLETYDTSSIVVETAIKNPQYSTADKLKAGVYEIECNYTFDDFVPVFVVDGKQYETYEGQATVKIEKKLLSLSAIGEALNDIFTKTYDETTDCVIERDGQPLLQFEGLLAGDVVTLDSAVYASAKIGTSIRVDFVLGGTDSECYRIESWAYGIINPIIVGISFNYNVADPSGIERLPIGYQNLTALAYPFLSTSSLTTNSNDQNTSKPSNFPSSLYGREGHKFEGWNLIFDGVLAGSSKEMFIKQLASSCGIEYTLNGGLFKAKVANNTPTVKFIDGLIGQDTENLFGLYYKANNNIQIEFVADWGVQTYKVSVAVTDKNGDIAPYGKFEIGGVEYTGPVNGREFEYNSSLTITATAYEHCTFIGLYNNRRIVTDGDIPHYIDGNKIVITIGSVAKNYDLEIRFSVQYVNIVFDLSAYDNSTISNTDFTKSGSVYSMTKDYLKLKNVTLANVGISRVGYILKSVTANGITVLAKDFATTPITEFVSTTVDETVNFVLGFEPVGILVNLDYGFDSRVDAISVDYGRTYGDSIDWIDEPIRTGYDFAGWYNQNDVRVTADTVVENLQEHTLTAHWTLADFNLVVEAENAKIYVEDELTEKIETTVKYQQTYTFKVVADDGYLINASSTYPSGFVVTLENEKTANVVVTMPGVNISYKFVSKADQNTITFAGNKLQKIEVFEVSAGETEIVVSENSAIVETGKKYKIVVTANAGYDMSDVVDTSVDYLGVSKTVSDNGVLTIFVEGIKENVEFTFYTQEGLNTINFAFDENDKISQMIAGNRIYTEFNNISFNVYTDDTFELYVFYKEGYQYKDYTSAEGIVATVTKTTYNDRETYKVVLSNVTTGSITLNTEFKKFDLSIEVVSYDAAGNVTTESGNRAYIRHAGISYEEITLDYLTQVDLRAEAGQSYSFAGWSKNKFDIYDTNAQTNYTITKDEKIYAIFSAVRFEITFATIDRKVTYAEYNDPDKLVVEYEMLKDAGEKYCEDEDLTQEITTLSIYYGSNKTIFYKNPVGYNIIAFGHYVGSKFVLISEVNNQHSVPSFTISTTDDYMDVEQTEKTIYVVVSAKTLRVDVSTKIFFENALEENENVGTVKLVSEVGDDVNEYGYVEGTRVRYENFSEVDFKNYTFIACTTDEAFLKVETVRAGYKLYSVSVNGEGAIIDRVGQTDAYAIYKLSGLVGGRNIGVSVYFKPLLNKIVVDYMVEDEFVDGGVLSVAFEGNNSYKVFTSGAGKSMIEVSAYTDSKFKVISYTNLGYVVDPEFITIVDENGIVLTSSVNYRELSIEQTGYNSAIEFEVEGFLGDNEISIVVIPRKFTVNFVENDETLVSIKNVEYGKLIDLSKENAENIEIIGTGIGFKEEKLNLVFAKQNFNYQGFFSYENGAGVRYIDAEGEVLKTWTETGYSRNNVTSKYELATNTKVNQTTGEFEVSLYIYWSYLKTRITFEFSEALSSLVTAKDLIKGVDYTNSWYYDSAPNYIEVSYNTRISISAPELDGYKFYQFVISQKDANGEELTDVVTYSNDIPWETNELDNIVEVKIKVVYFARIEVVVEGGKGSFEIEQEYKDSQAKDLIEQNYIDTTKAFTISAIIEEGYQFESWYNIETGKRSWASNGVWENVKAEVASIFILTLKGKEIKLSFKDESDNLYDTTFGQIYTAKIESLTGTRTEILAKNNNGTLTVLKDNFDVIVGDKITFNMAITFGFAVVWNVDNVNYSSYKNDRYEFELEIVGSMAQEDVLRVLPEFKNTILSIFVNGDFVEDDKNHNAVDDDNVSFAGRVVYNNSKTDLIYADRDKDIVIKFITNQRYALHSIMLVNGETEIEIPTDFEDDTLVLTREFVEDNQIIGVVSLNILYNRKLWENAEASESLTGNGDGSPYQINSLEDLVFMMQKVNSGAKNSNGIYYAEASYIVNCDIDLSEQFWTPIGTNAYAFNGKFNFNGHTISAIYNPYFYDEINYNGLFGVLGDNAEIISNSVSVWYWYLSGGVVLVLIGTVTAITVVSKKKKKQRERMSAK